MEKMKMHSYSRVDANVKKIEVLFPNCVTEVVNNDGELERVVDFDALKEEFSTHAVEGKKERYQFTWPDKNKAKALLNQDVTSTLRPFREESVDFDSTENLYIEGDNLEVLKLLQETYLGKIKMIYIDPPYNTGNDFVYEDDFSTNAEDYKGQSGQYSSAGDRLVTNLESNGRFHTDWLNMIYPRLRIARDLLSEDGVIFMSIDDNEVRNLKNICDEIFGEKNFIAQLIWERAYSPKNDARFVSNSHDYILMYAKDIDIFTIGRLPRSEEANSRYNNPDNDPRGPWKPGDISVKTYNPSTDYSITTPSGRIVNPPLGKCWRFSETAYLEKVKDNRIWFGSDGNSVPSVKRFLSELKHDGMAPTSILFYKEVGHSQEGAQEVTKLLNAGVFDGPKPVRLIYRLLQLANLEDDSIVLDFFSGSATTAHALMKYNIDNSSNRKYIMVQIPEICDSSSKAKESGYETICDIGIDRIRKAGNLLKADNPLTASNLDVGFRVLKLDSSNMNDIYYKPSDYSQDMLAQMESNIKSDRTSEDLLFQVMLDLGVELSSKIDSMTIKGKEVFNVAEGWVMACFDEDVSEDVIIEVAKQKPRYFVMRDSSMAHDTVSVNFDEIFNRYSPETIRKVM